MLKEWGGNFLMESLSEQNTIIKYYKVNGCQEKKTRGNSLKETKSKKKLQIKPFS